MGPLLMALPSYGGPSYSQYWTVPLRTSDQSQFMDTHVSYSSRSDGRSAQSVAVQGGIG